MPEILINAGETEGGTSSSIIGEVALKVVPYGIDTATVLPSISGQGDLTVSHQLGD